MPVKLPTVTVIIPCFNEEATISRLLEALIEQTYPRERMDVVISDGLSTDETRTVISGFQRDHPDLALQVVENPTRTIPSAINQAIQMAKGEIIVRLDAHSIPADDYLQRCVSALESGKGDIVGGVWQIQSGVDNWMARSIALAASHPLGAGDAQYRLNPRAGYVDTVPFGSFRRDLIARIGKFDENLLTNEDYEFNSRLRQAGGRVWLDPSIRSVYFSRSTLVQLARQYARYGFWKWRMLLRHPASLRWRQALPPLFTLILALLTVLSLWFDLALIAWAGLILIYISVLGMAGLGLAIQKKSPFYVIGFPLAVAVMHLTWGAGFLWSMIAGWWVFSKNG